MTKLVSAVEDAWETFITRLLVKSLDVFKFKKFVSTVCIFVPKMYQVSEWQRAVEEKSDTI